MSSSQILAIVIESVLIAVGVFLVLLTAHWLFTVVIPRLLQVVLVRITLRIVRRAIERLSVPVEPTGIAEIEGDVGIGLPLGSQHGLTDSDQFIVVNTTNQEKWGTLQVYEIRETSCICTVFDRTNPDFWDTLEERMRRDASPPQGVTLVREIPEEFLFDWLNRLLRAP